LFDGLGGIEFVPLPLEVFVTTPNCTMTGPDKSSGPISSSAEAEEGGFIVLHASPGIGSADEAPAVQTSL
jgi:hypothetical protein